jgi:thiamine pyrophosphate-dependent acetolactate synthase large subunit-like protein
VKARQGEIADKWFNVIEAECISDPGDLRLALLEALTSRRPRIIEVMVSPDAYPPLSLYDVKKAEAALV